ncbi:tRNA (adenosine(37)-N6)-threonylcarbamoyltransferase complex dimerization subunit type 1 TsaB [Roseovarius autotrophicus]|uniref:tRNA (adenosine(37)-N6)-threonylcarbamoyltransferase complex dimerization subunit type 1 TsaB n=1 Tax=Roseovarius autotrophicus TaxID=2824121 RepID=UPI0019EC5CCC|nr:tRNA (adenosine(37)-N6)-threonylcarbamoyltransferase complex dimerization subunit type 1 TsaB [Roseovarius autotrophicus]MBE0452687.1 tRNA (adenosine(37)-N6)-threonylcarbamoyltransferase complex dimerization subunit type 1 TsaB [Roseovarius sp.]
MASDDLVLGFDTSAAHCAAALLAGDRVLAWRAEEMGRGQAERLMPLLGAVLAEGGATWRDLARIGVGIGPGNFTGIRIAVAAARGLALSLEIPAIGVSTFDAIRASGGTGTPAVPAPRGMVHVATPALVPAESVADPLGPPTPACLAQLIAKLAQVAPEGGPPPAPLYLRPADAAPARDAPPVILDDA